MKNLKKLVVGSMALCLMLTVSVALFPATTFAVTASNEQQLRTLAGNLRVQENGEIRGQMNGTTIIFKKKVTQTLAGNVTSYEATNLDCGGQKAVVNRIANQLIAPEDAVYLIAKHSEGGGCSDVKRIKSGITIAQWQQAGGGTSTGDGTEAEDGGEADLSCDTKLTNPLSWILCPVIEVGSDFTDFVFKNIVSELLKEVPISPDPEDPGYKAWNQFRILGNIVLVGTMLAVVYAQVKGDR